MKLLSDTILKDQPIVAFVDKNPVNHRKVLRGTEILAPDQICEQGLQYPIVVASLLHGQSIERDIKYAYNLENPVVRLTP